MNGPRFLEQARLAARGIVCSVDHLATAAGSTMLATGGTAVDAAVAASAVLAVTTQHMCGMGGDLWALVHDGPGSPATLNASGRAGSGSDAGQLRIEGHRSMPLRGDIRSTPVPGCVDGWLTIHERYGRAPLLDVLTPAIELAELGFPASGSLAAAAIGITTVEGADDFLVDGRAVTVGQRVRRPGLARSLRAIASEGRNGWYQGEFGHALVNLGHGVFTEDDLARSQADWVEPLMIEAWGHRIWTVPPNSQGYLSLAGAAIAEATGLLPADPSDPVWAHVLIEAAKQAAYDRATVLHEHANGSGLLAEDRLRQRAATISLERAASLVPPARGGGTIYLCVVDEDRMGVSLIQSNAAGFGAHLAVPGIGVFLQNRGIGFSLDPGHPAELGPGRRPPSTLAPALVTTPGGALRSVLGTMGGDGQPQVVLQMLAHLLDAGSSPGTAVTHPRFTLTVPEASGFDTWGNADRLAVAIESGGSWADGLVSRGHRLELKSWGESMFGHAHLINVGDDHLAGVAEPRAATSAVVGL